MRIIGRVARLDARERRRRTQVGTTKDARHTRTVILTRMMSITTTTISSMKQRHRVVVPRSESRRGRYTMIHITSTMHVILELIIVTLGHRHTTTDIHEKASQLE